jgi:predicted lactoylglutathione lyase
MNRHLSVTLPVASLSKSLAFFKALGFSHNPQFTGDAAACIVINETVFVMLLPQAKFSEFSPKAICDTSKAAEVLLGISCESRAQVDDMIAKAGEAGGTIYEQSVDYGFMYHGSFADPDGHLWALNYMNGAPPQS